MTAFGGQNRAAEKYSKDLIDAEKFRVKKSVFAGLTFGFSFLAMYCAYALTFWYGGKLVVEEDVNVV